MRYLIIIGNGMADKPIAELGNITPLQAANSPSLDYLAKMLRNGLDPADSIWRFPSGYKPKINSESTNYGITYNRVIDSLLELGATVSIAHNLTTLPHTLHSHSSTPVPDMICLS